MEAISTGSLTRRRPPRESGVVLVITLLIVIVLTGMAIVFARSMRVEAMASANQLARAQARAIALGAAQAVMALGDELPADAVELGGGAFWILQPNFEDDRISAFGIVDESSKINLNTATEQQLLALPGVDELIAAAIIDWRDSDAEPSPNGAESDYYLMQNDPYLAKDGNFETVEELLLVRGITAVELYGEDKNRNGILDENENDASDSDPPDNRDGKLDRGLFDFVTVYSSEPSASRTNVNGSQSSGGSTGGASTGGASPGGAAPGGGGQSRGGSSGGGEVDQALLQALTSAGEEAGWKEDRINEIARSITSGRPFSNMVDFFYKSGMTLDEFNDVHDLFTTSSEEQKGLVNVNSAPREVLMAIGLEESEADALISYRLSAGATTGSGVVESESQETGELASVAWITQVLEQSRAVAIGSTITTESFQRSADIVAVSGNGRAFERYRLVYDTSSGTQPRVLCWQRLTYLGWPLDPQILVDLKNGKPVSDLIQTTNRGSF